MPVDFQRLEEVCMGDTDAMLDLTEFFFSQADQEMARLRAALDVGSIEDARRLTHRLLGASAGCGMTGMVAPIAEMEELAKQGEIPDANERFAQLTSLLAQSREAVAQWRASIQEGGL